MSTLRKWQQKVSLILGLGITSTVAIPFLSVPASAQASLSDIQGHWAQSCIQSLTQQGIINGYPDSSFRPNAPVNRAEYATLVGNAFPNAPRNQSARSFRDVSSNFWAYNAIRTATQTGFLTGYPDGRFQSNQNIPRAQVLVSLSNGLDYAPNGSVNAILDRNFSDAGSIPSYARRTIAAAAENQLVVNYPNVRYLNPNQTATRADVAAFLCQALKSPQQASLLPSQYIAGDFDASALTAGTTVPVTYAEADRVIVSPQETAVLTLTVDANIRDRNNNIVIPRGSEIIGELQPRDGGSQFVASTVGINGQDYPIQAFSDVITRTRSVNDPSLVSLARNSVIGAAAAAGISGLVGNRTITAEKVIPGAAVGAAIETNRGRAVTAIARDTAIGAALAAGLSGLIGDRTITAEKVLSGAASGAAIGGVIDPNVKRVVVIEPDADLTLELSQPLQVAQR
ncbi:MAG: S-layer homology domain-containing protein [Cyanobacteria bacterium P01_A01_bin.17]